MLEKVNKKGTEKVTKKQEEKENEDELERMGRIKERKRTESLHEQKGKEAVYKKIRGE